MTFFLHSGWVYVDDDFYWVFLDDDIYWVHELPLYSEVVLTCDDDRKNMEGLLFRRDPWDSVSFAFNV